MAKSKTAKKVLRSSPKKRVFNLRRSRVLHDVVKDIRGLIEEGKGADAKKLLPKAYQAIDKGVKRGIIKKNTGDRKKSRLSIAIKKVS